MTKTSFSDDELQVLSAAMEIMAKSRRVPDVAADRDETRAQKLFKETKRRSPAAAIISSLAALVTALASFASQIDLSGKVSEAVARQTVGIDDSIKILDKRLAELEDRIPEATPVQEITSPSAGVSMPEKSRARYEPAAASDPRVQKMLQGDPLW